jgi:hypothetical protein
MNVRESERACAAAGEQHSRDHLGEDIDVAAVIPQDVLEMREDGLVES